MGDHTVTNRCCKQLNAQQTQKRSAHECCKLQNTQTQTKATEKHSKGKILQSQKIHRRKKTINSTNAIIKSTKKILKTTASKCCQLTPLNGNTPDHEWDSTTKSYGTRPTVKTLTGCPEESWSEEIHLNQNCVFYRSLRWTKSSDLILRKPVLFYDFHFKPCQKCKSFFLLGLLSCKDCHTIQEKISACVLFKTLIHITGFS